jgi:4-amino-4-deoxy-L-arabinose transferase-like glycosyltransferase
MTWVISLLLIIILITGFALRLNYALNTSPYFDEYLSIAAAQSIQDHGTTVMRSGAFYGHGLLFSYLAALAGALIAWGQAALLTAPELPFRLTSVFLGTITIAAVYRLGKQEFSPLAGLLAASLLALESQSIIWGGRARMYSLLQLLVLLTVYAAFRGAYGEGNARWRIYGLLLLALTFVTQFWTVILLAALLPGIILVAWFSRPANAKPWFWQRSALWLLPALGLVLCLGFGVELMGGVLVGRPPQIGSYSAGTSYFQQLTLLLGHVQIEFLPEQVRYLSKYALEADFFRAVALILASVGILSLILAARRKKLQRRQLIFGLFLFFTSVIVLTGITFIGTRNPELRYFVPLIPLVSLLAGGCLHSIWLNLEARVWKMPLSEYAFRLVAITLVLLVAAGVLGYGVTQRLATINEDATPGYDHAFRFVRENLQMGDAIATMNTPASALHLGQADYFIGQYQVKRYTTTGSDGRDVDRWWGAPHLSTGADLQQALENHPRVWLIVDSALFNESFFGADWFLVSSVNMEPVWENKRITVLVSRPQLDNLNLKPAVALEKEMADIIFLRGYDLSVQSTALTVTLFWQARRPIDVDYTQFVHIRDGANQTVLQADKQPTVPTTRWRPGELVADIVEIPLPSDIPAGPYRILVGMYRWDTLERLPVVGDQSGENAVLLEQLHVP